MYVYTTQYLLTSFPIKQQQKYILLQSRRRPSSGEASLVNIFYKTFQLYL